MKVKIYTDGAARGNPGPAASAFLILVDNQIIKKGVSFLGKSTNNVAEYRAIINALKIAKNITKSRIELFSDSDLAIKQITNKWKTKASHLKNLRNEVIKRSKYFKSVNYFHIGRENSYIQLCDKMCNERLDKAMDNT